MKNSKTILMWIVAAIGALIWVGAWFYWLSIRHNFGDYSGSSGEMEFFYITPLIMIFGAIFGAMVGSPYS